MKNSTALIVTIVAAAALKRASRLAVAELACADMPGRSARVCEVGQFQFITRFNGGPSKSVLCGWASRRELRQVSPRQTAVLQPQQIDCNSIQ
jgi:hypothetical protein